MKIETKFSNGDRVYAITSERVKVWHPCGFCGATGRIAGADATDRSCPECVGRRGSYTYEDKGWNVELMPLTIGQVRVEITETPGSGDPDEIFDNFKPRTDYDERYMCVETGVGSGTLHNGEKLFATREAAIAACDERKAATRDAGAELTATGTRGAKPNKPNPTAPKGNQP